MKYAKHYSESSLWQKLSAFAAAAGRQVVEKVLVLYEVLKDPDTPAWARATILGALGYFILPFDAIPDVIPVAGFTDDLTALGAAIAAVASVTKSSHIAAARARLSQWFSKSA